MTRAITAAGMTSCSGCAAAGSSSIGNGEEAKRLVAPALDGAEGAEQQGQDGDQQRAAFAEAVGQMMDAAVEPCMPSCPPLFPGRTS